MIFFLDNIISKDECQNLTKLFFEEKNNILNTDNFTIGAAKFSYGFEPQSAEFNKYLDILKPKIEELSGQSNLGKVNSYVRIYYNNAELEKHVDRTDIGITLSVCLDLNIKSKWPLCADVNYDVKCYHTNIGQGVLLLDSFRFTHWRDKLECNDDEYVLQFFLHWSKLQKSNKTIL